MLETFIIIGITTVISFKGFENLSFFNRYKFQIAPIKSGDKFRMFSCGFLHVNTMHLILNMLTLYFFAPIVVRLMGSFWFIAIYIISLLLGSILSYTFNKSDPNYSAVGASGAVIGVLYAAILLFPNMTLGLFFIIPIPGYMFAIGFLIYSIWGMKSKSDNIGHDAHFGGAIGGLITTTLLKPEVITNEPLIYGLMILPIAVLFYLKKQGKL